MASQNSWGGQFTLGGSALQVAAALNLDGRLEIFYVGTNSDLFRNTQSEADGLLWDGQAAFPGNSAQQIAAARNKNGVLEIFYVGTNNDLYHNMQTAPGSGTWVGETHFPGDSAQQVAVGANANGLLEIFYVGTNNDIFHQWQRPNAQGFGSNSNYLLASDCNPLLGVTVTIDVTQDIVAVANTGPTRGFGFQLNAYSPKNEKSAIQQYSIALFGSEVVGFVYNWPLQGGAIVHNVFDIVSLPSPKIPAGYQLTISLQNDARGNITGAMYTVVDDHGKTLASVMQVLTSLTGAGALSGNASDLAPIVAFQLNLVGPVGGEGAVLSSGAGTFTYTATVPLTAPVSEPPCAEYNGGTVETANSEYGALPAQASTSLAQPFSVWLTAAETI